MNEAGPELDAKLAEAMGKGVCRDPRCSGENCPGTTMYLAEDGWIYSDEEYGDAGSSRYSRDVAAAISAAEDMRKAGRISGWRLEAYSDNAEAWAWDGRNLGVAGQHAFAANTPAYALTLALLSALGGVVLCKRAEKLGEQREGS